MPGIAGWDGTQNAVGAAGSGSLKLEQAGSPNVQRVCGMRQRIHLPGPGVYALNGWGRAGAGGTGNRDYVYLRREFRRSGGDHFLSNSSSWHRPVRP